MQKLPKGYYAVACGGGSHRVFSFRGTEYEVNEGQNLFFSLEEAVKHAAEVPERMPEGLSLSGCSAPVILFSPGRHCIDDFVFPCSLILLGAGAGINPNLPQALPDETPQLNPARSTNESVLYGSYWYGKMSVRGADVKTIIADGFSFEQVRFADYRKVGKKAYISFRNIIHISPCGHHLYRFASSDKGACIDREVLMKNIRVSNFDDLDYAGCFLLLHAKKCTLEGICYDTTGQIFGVTNISRTHRNASAVQGSCELNITGCCFRNLTGAGAIRTGYDPEEALEIHVRVSDSVFHNAAPEGESPVSVQLPGKRSSILVERCRFVDRRGNSSPAVTVLGEDAKVCLKDCEIQGFSGTYVTEELPTVAPDVLVCHTENGRTVTSDPHRLTEGDFTLADQLYSGKKAYYGDLHVHTDCGGTSDGALLMKDWCAEMNRLHLDFAAVVDHRQMRGFFLPEWSEERFLIGTEPATAFLNLKACRHSQNEIHYIMLFPHRYSLAMVLANFPEFVFHGTELNGSFDYPDFTKECFSELTQFVEELGGIMIHAHPKTMMSSDDPMDYYFGERTYLETIYGDCTTHATRKNYELWVRLLGMGKHILASGGSDTHGAVSNRAVSTFYTAERSGNAFFRQMRTGDFTVGGVGIQMCADGAPMGSEVVFRPGMTLTLRIRDFYPPTFTEKTVYRLRIYTDRGVAYEAEFNGREPQKLALEICKRRFYRAEIYDLTHNCLTAVGNPIWLS